MGRVTECQQMSVILSRSRARNHHHFIYKSSSSSVLRACDTGDTGKRSRVRPPAPPRITRTRAEHEGSWGVFMSETGVVALRLRNRSDAASTTPRAAKDAQLDG